MENLLEEKMCVLVAPDGSPQPMTLAADFASCVATVRLMHKSKLGKSLHELLYKGFKILPVKVTIIQNGTGDEAFQAAKREEGNGKDQ